MESYFIPEQNIKLLITKTHTPIILGQKNKTHEVSVRYRLNNKNI